MHPNLSKLMLLMAALSLAACAAGIEPSGRRVRPVGSPPPPVAIPVDTSRYSIHGVDVSKYQGAIDWVSTAQAGTQFAWIKATEGADLVDDRFSRNWQDAKEAGVPRGAYHFAYWCRTPAEQMRWFEQNVPVDEDALPPVLDVELTPTSRTCKRTLYREEVLQEMKEMLVEMERHYGKRPVIYTTVDFYAGILHSSALAEYPLWVRSTKYDPVVKYPGRKWHFWQYQSDGSVAGIGARVDRNAFHGDGRQWEAFLAGKGDGLSRHSPHIQKNCRNSQISLRFFQLHCKDLRPPTLWSSPIEPIPAPSFMPSQPDLAPLKQTEVVVRAVDQRHCMFNENRSDALAARNCHSTLPCCLASPTIAKTVKSRSNSVMMDD